jgi:cyclic beta-1,2-glucan synthetase
MLGFNILAKDGAQHLVVDPCIPKRWPSFEITYRHATATYKIRVDNPRGVNRGVARVSLDGERLESLSIPLVDDGSEHEVLVTMLGG